MKVKCLAEFSKKENENENKVSNVIVLELAGLCCLSLLWSKRLAQKAAGCCPSSPLVHSSAIVKMCQCLSVSQCKLKRNPPFHTLFLHFFYFIFFSFVDSSVITQTMRHKSDTSFFAEDIEEG